MEQFYRHFGWFAISNNFLSKWLFGIWWGSLFFTTEITESTEKNL